MNQQETNKNGHHERSRTKPRGLKKHVASPRKHICEPSEVTLRAPTRVRTQKKQQNGTLRTGMRTKTIFNLNFEENIRHRATTD